MSRADYYRGDLAWIHHAGYARHAESVGPGIVRLLEEGGLRGGASVTDVGCGSGVLAKVLCAAGFRVRGFDASPAMIELARAHEAGAQFDVLRLPTRRPGTGDGGLPGSDAVVSTGHVLNYLDSRDDVALALAELADALPPGGVLALDLMTEAFPARRAEGEVHAKVEDDWALVTRFSRPGPFRFDRAITTFRRDGDLWRRSDEHHRNVTFEADEALRILRARGVDAEVRASFGGETLPEGLVVLSGRRARASS